MIYAKNEMDRIGQNRKKLGVRYLSSKTEGATLDDFCIWIIHTVLDGLVSRL